MVDLAAEIAFTGKLAAMARAPHEFNGLGRLLGSLEAQVSALTSTVANLTTRWEIQDQKASEGRRVLHEKVDACTVQVAETRGAVQTTQQDVAELRNDITDLEGWRTARERERIEHAAQKKLLDRINGKVWAALCGLAMLAGGLLAALALELAKRYM